MIKNIRVTNNKTRPAFRYTTNGSVYTATVDGVITIKGVLSFVDDTGEWVSFFEDGRDYEVVEETQPEDEVSMKTINDWNTEDWDEIPADVEAVVTYNMAEDTFFKKIGDKLYSQCWRDSVYKKSVWDEYSDIVEHFGDRFHLRPSPITQPTPVPPESTQVESSEVETTTTPEFDWDSMEDDVEAVVVEDGEILQQLKSVEGRVFQKGKMCGKERWLKGPYNTLSILEKHFHLLGYVSGKLIRRPPAITTLDPNTIELDHGLSKEELALLERNLTQEEFGWYLVVSTQMRRDLIKNATTTPPEVDIYKKVVAEVDKIDIDMTSMKGTIFLKPEVDMYDMFKETIRGSNLDHNTPPKPPISTILQEAQQSILKHHGVTGKVKFTVTCSQLWSKK